MKERATIKIVATSDIVAARQMGREMAAHIGFSTMECTLIATIISELARNIIVYAKTGVVDLARVTGVNRVGLQVTASDNGPGIKDVERALIGGFSSSGGLGLGISGAKRVMDDLTINTKVGKGTIITTTKWLAGDRMATGMQSGLGQYGRDEKRR